MKSLILFLIFNVIGCMSFADSLTTGTLRTATADTPTVICPAKDRVNSIVISCLSTNTEVCIVGDSNIDHPTLRGIEIATGSSLAISASSAGAKIDCNLLYFEVGVNSEGISYSTLK